MDPVTAGYLNELPILLETRRGPQTKLFLNPTQFQEVFYCLCVIEANWTSFTFNCCQILSFLMYLFFLGITAAS